MKRIRVIPVLLIKNNGLVKSVRFKNHRYVGDPINAVKIFNDKEVDELAIVDIDASRENRKPDIKKLAELAGEAFMPLAYGGGITTVEEVREIFFNGFEKVIINKAALNNPRLITEIADRFGNQAVVASIDVKKNFFGKYKVYGDNGQRNTKLDPVEYAVQCEKAGAGEILVNDIDRDGTYSGYNLELLKELCTAVSVPVIACGGASSVDDFRKAVVESNASAVAAGSMFVFQRPHNAVLISYPSQRELIEKIYKQIK